MKRKFDPRCKILLIRLCRELGLFLNSSRDGTDTRYGWVCKIIVMISLSVFPLTRMLSMYRDLASDNAQFGVLSWDINCSPALSTSWMYINELCNVRDSRPLEREIQRTRTNREHFLDECYGALRHKSKKKEITPRWVIRWMNHERKNN